MKCISGCYNINTGQLNDFSIDAYAYEDARMLFRLLTSRNHWWYDFDNGNKIVELFLRYGNDITMHLSGLYMLLIYNKEKGSLHFYHDRSTSSVFLYYTLINNCFYYSNSLKWLLKTSSMQRKMDDNQLEQFMKNGYITGSETLVQNVKKLGAFYSLFVNRNMVKQIPVTYSIPFIGISDALLQWKTVLDDAICRTFVKEDEINMAISAGYDSNYIMYVASLAEELPINAFSVGGKNGKNEIPLVQCNIKAYNNVSLFTSYTDSNTLLCLPDIVWRLEGSVYECGVFLQYELARLARSMKKKYLICGECADQVMNMWFYDDYQTKPHGVNKIYKSTEFPYLFGSYIVLKKSGLLTDSFGIEARYPYLDNRFQAIAKSIGKINGISKKHHVENCIQTLPKEVVVNLSKIGGSTDCHSLFNSSREVRQFKAMIEHTAFFSDYYFLIGRCSECSSHKSHRALKWFSDIRNKMSTRQNSNKDSRLSKEYFYDEICIREYVGYAYLILFQKLFLSGEYDGLFDNNGIDVSLSDLL